MSTEDPLVDWSHHPSYGLVGYTLGVASLVDTDGVDTFLGMRVEAMSLNIGDDERVVRFTLAITAEQLVQMLGDFAEAAAHIDPAAVQIRDVTHEQ